MRLQPKKTKYKKIHKSKFVRHNFHANKLHLKLGTIPAKRVFVRNILPTNKHLRLLLLARRFLPGWNSAKFGLKVDAFPSRLNQINLFIKRIRVFFDICKEICDRNEDLPIEIVSLPTMQFHNYIMTKLEQVKEKNKGNITNVLKNFKSKNRNWSVC